MTACRCATASSSTARRRAAPPPMGLALLRPRARAPGRCATARRPSRTCAPRRCCCCPPRRPRASRRTRWYLRRRRRQRVGAGYGPLPAGGFGAESAADGLTAPSATASGGGGRTVAVRCSRSRSVAGGGQPSHAAPRCRATRGCASRRSVRGGRLRVALDGRDLLAEPLHLPGWAPAADWRLGVGAAGAAGGCWLASPAHRERPAPIRGAGGGDGGDARPAARRPTAQLLVPLAAHHLGDLAVVGPGRRRHPHRGPRRQPRPRRPRRVRARAGRQRRTRRPHARLADRAQLHGARRAVGPHVHRGQRRGERALRRRRPLGRRQLLKVRGAHPHVGGAERGGRGAHGGGGGRHRISPAAPTAAAALSTPPARTAEAPASVAGSVAATQCLAMECRPRAPRRSR